MDRQNGENRLCNWRYVTVLAIGLVGLAKIHEGSIYLYQYCDIEKMIPIYLIVSGVLMLLFDSLIVISYRRHDVHENDFLESLGRLGGAIWRGLPAFLIHTLWLMYGSIWVYPNYLKMTSYYGTCSQDINSDSVHGPCNTTFLKFAFYIDWICFSLVVICLMICWIALTYQIEALRR